MKSCSNVFAFYMLSNAPGACVQMQNILSTNKLVINDVSTNFIAPIYEWLTFKPTDEEMQMLASDVFANIKDCPANILENGCGIGFRISKLRQFGLLKEKTVFNYIDYLTLYPIPKNTVIDLNQFSKKDIVVLCPTDKDFNPHYITGKIKYGKNYPIWRWMCLSHKTITGIKRSDKGLDEYLSGKFDTRNYDSSKPVEKDESALF